MLSVLQVLYLLEERTSDGGSTYIIMFAAEQILNKNI